MVLAEKRNAVTNQDWQNRITKFVGETKAKAVSRYEAASDKPDRAKRRAQSISH